MKKLIFSLLLLLGVVLPMSAFGQMVDKSEANRLKKNENILYGEAVASTEPEAYKLAFEDLMNTIREYRDENPDLFSADAIVIQNVQSKTKQITYMKNVQTKVVCVYVMIKDIVPLYQGSAESLGNDDTIVLLQDTATQRQPDVPVVAQEVHCDLEAHIDHAEQAVTEPVAQHQEEPAAAIVSQTTPAIGIEAFHGTDKEKIVLKDLSSLTNYQQVKEYLAARKQVRHDVSYRPFKNGDDGQKDCLWIVFDASLKVIALFDRKMNANVLTGAQDQLTNYNANSKMWIIVYDE